MTIFFIGFTKILITISEILTAGIAVTAFSLLLYATTFNLRNRVARSFAAILLSIVIVFSAEALKTTATTATLIDFWLHIQWIGIIFLPASYLHFSDSLLSTTGRPSRWRRKWAVRVAYFISIGLLITLPSKWLLGPVISTQLPVTFNQPTLLSQIFTIYYIVVMVLSWVNFIRALRRTVTITSRRRMTYLAVSALAPAIGIFPYLLNGSAFAGQFSLAFWLVTIVINLLTGALIVVMAYAVAFFGISWPDRIVKSRLIKWLLRGPLTASLTLALVTIVRRAGDAFGGNPYSALVPITMIVTVLLLEYAITVFFPKFEQIFLFGKDQQELIQLRSLEERLITHSDLSQFLEMVLAAICDQLQAPGAYLATNTEGNFEVIASTGFPKKSIGSVADLEEFILSIEPDGKMFQWNKDVGFPLKDGGDEPALVGYLVVRNPNQVLIIDEEAMAAVRLLNHRAAIALRDREIQEQVFSTLEKMDTQVEMIQTLRAFGRYDRQGVLTDDQTLANRDMTQWVRDALTHYWGGPKLTDNPLISLQIVKQSMEEQENNSANALRGILKRAIDKLKPEGERKYTSEWILYNILDLKFLEGKKVREIAMRLAMSEADLYRKQRVAIDAVATEIAKMESLITDETNK
ncbi:MAG: histidine kinase N-terminal 7TM domain-containing protein [Anaerolineaceae bacterium]